MCAQREQREQRDCPSAFCVGACSRRDAAFALAVHLFRARSFADLAQMPEVADTTDPGLVHIMETAP